MMRRWVALAVVLVIGTCADASPDFDVLISGGIVFDGSVNAPFVGDVGISGDRVAAVGDLAGSSASTVVDATDMLSWSTESLIIDGHSQGDIRQGVTLEVFGEGVSFGPLNDAMKTEMLKGFQADYGASVPDLAALLGGEMEIPWTTLGEYLEFLEAKGIATNVASFLGATTARIHELGYEDRPPDADELERMRQLVHTAMQEGALGIGSSLIYAPAFYASTDELVALAAVAAEYGGTYISHMRNESDMLLEAVEELISISRDAGIPAEIYHLKAAGQDNWAKMDQVIAMVEEARAEGLRITADMYTYPAGSTGLDAAMPPWVQEGGYDAWAERLQDAATRARVSAEMIQPPDGWENLMRAAGPEGTLLVGFRNPELRHYIGRTLAEVAAERGVSPEDAAMDLVVEDGTRVQVVYFLMSEENIEKQIALPWVAFDSDAASMAPVPPFIEPWHRGPGDVGRGLLRRRGGVRSGHGHRPRHLRGSAPVLHRGGSRVGQRGTGASRRGSHRGHDRARRAGTGVDRSRSALEADRAGDRRHGGRGDPGVDSAHRARDFPHLRDRSACRRIPPLRGRHFAVHRPGSTPHPPGAHGGAGLHGPGRPRPNREGWHRPSRPVRGPGRDVAHQLPLSRHPARGAGSPDRLAH